MVTDRSTAKAPWDVRETDHSCHAQQGDEQTKCGRLVATARVVNTWDFVTCPECLEKSGGGQVFRLRDSFKVMWHGRVCSPDWHDRGAAYAYLHALQRGTRKPEYSHD